MYFFITIHYIMSWGTCYAGSNNIHFDFPPIMSDGRTFTDWVQGGALNKEIRINNNINNNTDYRKYLQRNADDIIKYNQIKATNMCSGPPAFYNQNGSVNRNPYLYKSNKDTTIPYGYNNNSTLRKVYFTKKDLQSRFNVMPPMTQQQLLSVVNPN